MKFRALGSMLAMLLLAVACAPVEDDGDVGANDEEETSEAQEEAQAEADPDATFRFGDPVGPSRFDPHLSTIGQDIRHFAPVYDRLVHLSPEGDPIPGLASHFEYSDDGLEFRMELEEGVTFHDGEEFNAEAVAANIERGQTLEGSSVAADLADIEEVEVVDEHEVVFHLSQPNSMLPGMLSHRAGAMISPGAFDNDDLDVMPVGAGMYEVSDHRPDDVITYERYDDYWDDDVVGAARFELVILPDPSARFNALRTGDVDIASLEGRQVSEAEAADLIVESDTALHYLVLYLNRASQDALEIPEVRQAMNHAIDKQAIVDSVLFGYGETASQPFPEGYWAHNPDFPGDYYEYDPERAQELLAEAGYEDGFEFELLVTALGVYEQSAEAAQSMLDEVGITANLRTVEPAQTADVYYAQQDGDALLSQWGGRPDPSMTIELQFSDEGFANPGRHFTEEMLELNREALETIDFDERQEVIHRNVAHIVEQAFQVPIAHDEGIYGMTDRVVGFETLVTGQANFRTLGLTPE